MPFVTHSNRRDRSATPHRQLTSLHLQCLYHVQCTSQTCSDSLRTGTCSALHSQLAVNHSISSPGSRLACSSHALPLLSPTLLLLAPASVLASIYNLLLHNLRFDRHPSFCRHSPIPYHGPNPSHPPSPWYQSLASSLR